MRPIICRVTSLDLRPGGSFVAEMSENDESFVPHLSACFLDVVHEERIVYTNMLTGGWRPYTNGFVTAVITLADHPDGTEYRALACTRTLPTGKSTKSTGFMMAGPR